VLRQSAADHETTIVLEYLRAADVVGVSVSIDHVSHGDAEAAFDFVAQPTRGACRCRIDDKRSIPSYQDGVVVLTCINPYAAAASAARRFDLAKEAPRPRRGQVVDYGASRPFGDDEKGREKNCKATVTIAGRANFM
jgi:hypothetical protein